MTLTPQWLDELRARTSLSTLIGKTVKVQKAGREYKACCPFHNEKTPSFTINDEKGFYHCFGCGAHGDAIRWMTDQRGLPFMEAVKELAATAGSAPSVLQRSHGLRTRDRLPGRPPVPVLLRLPVGTIPWQKLQLLIRDVNIHDEDVGPVDSTRVAPHPLPLASAS